MRLNLLLVVMTCFACAKGPSDNGVSQQGVSDLDGVWATSCTANNLVIKDAPYVVQNLSIQKGNYTLTTQGFNDSNCSPNQPVLTLQRIGTFSIPPDTSVTSMGDYSITRIYDDNISIYKLMPMTSTLAGNYITGKLCNTNNWQAQVYTLITGKNCYGGFPFNSILEHNIVKKAVIGKTTQINFGLIDPNNPLVRPTTFDSGLLFTKFQ